MPHNPVYTAWTSGDIGGTISAPPSDRIHTPSKVIPPRVFVSDDDGVVKPIEEVIKAKEKERKRKARKWKKRLKAIKRLLCKIKEKIKE